MNVGTLLDAAAREDPERPALVVDGGTLSYAGLAASVARCAAALARHGVGPGVRVPLLDDAGPLSVATVLAAARLGAAAAPMHAQLTARELAELVKTARCGATGVAGPGHAERLGRALGGTVLAPEDLAACDPADAPPPAGGADGAGEALVIFTSGTTGLPKPVGIPGAVLGPRVLQYAGRFDAAKPPARSLCCVPLVHVGGLVGVLVALAGGGTVVLQPRFEAGAWLRAVAAHRVQRVFLVPAMMRRLLDHPDWARADLSSLRLVSYGAAPAPPELVEAWVAALPGAAFSNVFGQTETTGAIAALGPEEHRLDAAGRLPRRGSVGRPLPGVEVRIVDPESGAPVPEGEPGELWVRSALNAAPGWRRTGDLVRRDADGHLYPSGRLSETLNRGGEKFGPAEIEAVLRAHPAVADAAVAGVPDPELGERVGAAVVRRAPVTADVLREHCRAGLARYKIPERFWFVDAIPYTEFGKVRRRELGERILREGA